MTTAELQINLINQITGITDTVRLQELLQVVKFQSDDTVYVTDDDEKRIITEAREEIKNGKVILNDDIQSEITAWLKK